MTDRVTRIQITTELGKYTFWADSWEESLEDDDRTLRLRGRGEGKVARAEHLKEMLAGGTTDRDTQHQRMLEARRGRA